MKLFLTGAAGFIGRSVTKRLLKYNNRVTTLLLPGEPEPAVEGSQVVRGDITKPDTLKGIMKSHDAVIHIAGVAGFQTWDACIAVNRDGTRHVAEEAVRSGIKRFVHMSSVSVYGSIPDTPIDESFPFKKIGDPYGDTKIDAENILNRFVSRGDLDLTVIRPTVVYGEGDDKFLPTLVQKIHEGKFRYIGNGKNSVDLIHVDDLSRFVWMVIHEPRSIGKIYNLTNPINPSWRGMVTEIATELGRPVPNGCFPYRLAYATALAMEKISKLTGNPPQLSRYAVRLVGRQYHYLTTRMQEDMEFTPEIPLMDGIRNCLSSGGLEYSR